MQTNQANKLLVQLASSSPEPSPLLGCHCTYIAPLDQIGLERSRLIELEEKSNGLQGKIGTQRKAMGGINAAREANIQVLLLRFICDNTTITVASTITAKTPITSITVVPTTLNS